MILFVFYVTYILEEMIVIDNTCFFTIFLFAVLGVPIWTFLSKKTNKVFTWRFSLILSSIIFLFVIFLESGDFTYFIIISCLTGLCLSADMLIPLSIQADIVDLHK